MSILNQLTKFFLVGIIINLIGYFIYIFIANFLMINPPVAAIAAGITVAPIGFQWNKRYSFENTNKGIAIEFKYYLLYIFTILMNAVNIWIFSNLIGFPHEITAAVSIAILALLSFLIQKFYIFKKKS